MSTAHDEAVLTWWNALDATEAAKELLPCCGSRKWADAVARMRPFADAPILMKTCDDVWWQMSEEDWDEAFATHPRIGEKKIPEAATAKSGDWSGQEQSGVAGANEQTLRHLREGNAAYERRFGRTYIVCASGKPAEAMLAILEKRLRNDDATELREAAEQQRQITHLRLRKWLRL